MKYVLVMIIAMAGAVSAYAEEPDANVVTLDMRPASFKLEDPYAWGVSRYNVDSHTEVIGWRLSETVFFGHQDGEDSGLSLVWQEDMNQVSLSKDGLRLTRRF